MKKSFINLLLFHLIAISNCLQAQVRIPFTQRTSSFSPTQSIYSINGDFTMIGNTNLTLQNYSNTDINSNNIMILVDSDANPSTVNSSSSTLTFSTENGANPSCSKVLFAGLYWTGRTDDNVNELQKRSVKFRGPGQTNYTTYIASSNNINYPGDNNMYVAFAEVTTQVQESGLGEYWVADMALTTGNGGPTGYYGGWGLVVVYENSKMKKRDITVFDGYAYVVGGVAQWELPVSGFTSALNGNVNTKLGLIAGEGDVSILGDKFEIQKLNTLDYLLLSHGGNAETNFFNSSIFTGGNPRNPNLLNNTGMDISMFTIPNPSNSVISNGQTSTTFRYSSTQDTYIIFSICLAVDAYEPVVEGFLSTLSVNGVPTSSEDITVLPGDEIQYKVQIRNKGTEAVNNARIEIPLPYAAIIYVGSSVNVYPPAVSTSLPYVDASLGANGTLIWDFGTLPLAADPNSVLGEIIFTLRASEDCELYRNFNCSAPSVEINGTISGIGANTGFSVDDQPFYVGFSLIDGCTTEPLLGPFNIAINSSDWVNTNCPPGDDIRDFTYCNRTTTIPITDVLGFYPVGTRFFNDNLTTEYTITNPFPNHPGPLTYRAQLPGSSCILTFTITITNINTSPSITTGTLSYCLNDIATPLTATPSNSSYQLFYYAPSSSIAQPLLIPSTSVAGDFIYQVAEGPTSTCISTARVNIPVQIKPLPSLTISPDILICAGSSSLLTVSGANSYQWYPATGLSSTTASSVTANPIITTTYTVKGTSSIGCTATKTVLVNVNPTPTAPVINVINTSSSVTLVASNYTGNLLWSNGATTPSITVTASGVYSVNQTVNSCPSPNASVNVSLLVITGEVTNPSCNNANTGSIITTVTGGTTPYTYIWSNGRTTKNNVNIVGGSYTVTVTSANGLTASKQFILTNPPVLVAYLNCPVACFNQCNGQATVTVSGGTPGYTYQWSGPNGYVAGNVSSITNLCPGTYRVTVTDSRGCKRIVSSNVFQNTQISINQIITPIACQNQCNGIITLAVSGGVAPYTYLWNNGTTKNNVANLCAGTYMVTVTDNKGCQATKAFTLVNPAPCSLAGGRIDDGFNLYDVNVYPNPTNNILNININAVGQSQTNIRITDLLGRNLVDEAKELSDGDNVITYNLADYAAGVYLIYIGNDTEQRLFKVVKE
ncbi:MAG: T9SS type A sorting domain-containing protein [Bacteroidetes bacterium]|nr:T9SS type A sorting domain-containing protein [Bacteroidota bacterium]